MKFKDYAKDYKAMQQREKERTKMADMFYQPDDNVDNYTLIINAKQTAERIVRFGADMEEFIREIFSTIGEEKLALAIVLASGEYYDGNFMMPSTRDAMENLSMAREKISINGEVELIFEDVYEFNKNGDTTTERNLYHYTFC